MNRADLAPLLDYTALAPDVSAEHVTRMCEEARAHGLAAVCLNPVHVERAAALLSGSETRVCTVVGYPLGALTARQKVYESATALDDGALEIEVVINAAALRAGDEGMVRDEIAAVADVVARNPHALVKVIVQTSLYDEAQKRLAIRLAIEGGAHFVVAATLSGNTAVTAADVALFHAGAAHLIGVKAAGVRTEAQTQELLAAGANRLGSEMLGLVTDDA